ncbi:Planctomycete cytochrome C [Stieleria bergensis]|uniref:Planctomycete cytochrome C n=2 Tax=Stieleria bergensis TaxID=2528025 RepID=A0A517SWF3_9BACT|nr:Planctomycete cytochrome C [Planctomycetes bacterium SV_7m_r]
MNCLPNGSSSPLAKPLFRSPDSVDPVMPRFLMLPLLVAVIAGNAAAADQGIEFFEKQVRPILVEHCYECHSAEMDVQGGLRLDWQQGIVAGGDSGPAIVKGKPHESLLIKAIEYLDRQLQMPPQNAIPVAQQTTLKRWIKMGAPDPRTTAPGETEGPQGMSVAEGRQFWSFQPVVAPPIPRIDSAFVQTPIDAFVLQQLQQQGLDPAPPADKSTLIRRATQDLIGLPATEQQVADYLSDESANAFCKVIERLLASHHHGQHWGRHWLDVARYADSNGLDENIGFGNAWRYRDYVIDAFNADKPYDRFLIEQLAGDLLPAASDETITATGFLQLGPKVLAEPDIEKLHLDTIDEQLDTVGKAFLGMTLGCVRCHDHKFDPIKQTDYYSLAAIFRSTQTFGERKNGAIKFWYEHSVGSDQDKERIAAVDKQLAALKSAASSFRNKAISELRQQARTQAADYLVACLHFEPNASLKQVDKIAQPLNLHPRVLLHCRSHLEFHREDPFFKDWHRLAKEATPDALRKHYSELFEHAEDAFAQAQQQTPKTKRLTDPTLEAARAALDDHSGFLAVPSVDAFAFDSETLTEHHRLLSIARAFETTAPDLPELMGVCDGEITNTMPVMIRGSHHNPGAAVQRGFPEVMRWSNQPVAFPDNASGRLELAQWIAAPEHPLTARVMVNRVWAWHFGQGLVASTENFGVMGQRPANQPLLDWLAAYFVRSGWSVKALHRIILNSSTWQMASTHADASHCQSIDPKNQLHWRQNLRRLQAEQIRDAILSVCGRLDPSVGGKTLPLRNRQFVFNHTSEDHTTYDSLRRAVYLPVIRNNLYSLFTEFDYPDPTMPTGVRSQTTVAPQALVLLNDPLILDSATALARRITRDSPHSTVSQIRELYSRCLARSPNEHERRLATAFLEKDIANPVQRLAMLCQAILCSHEFMYVN